MMRLEPLQGAVTGVSVRGMDLSALPPAASAEWAQLATAFTQHGLLVVHDAAGGSATPAQVEGFYSMMHGALGLREMRSHRQAGVGSSGGRGELRDNLRGAAFPGALGTNVLGHVPGGLDNWHGLSGPLQPASWWEVSNAQFHHDGSFSAVATADADEHDGAMTTVRDAPPKLLQMYCVDAPREGGGELDGGRVTYKAGATLLLSTTHALAAAPPDVAQRARRMTAVYTKGWGKIVEGKYPLMAPSGLRPLAPADGDAVSSDDRYVYRAETPATTHPLVMENPDTGRPFVFVHTVCLDHLAEDGRPLSWAESMSFLDSILDPALDDTIVVNWEPGVLAFWVRSTPCSRARKKSAAPSPPRPSPPL
eukprot:COSAG01_NODE_1770_length_9272_cov_5.371198_10_plen_365_part_00